MDCIFCGIVAGDIPANVVTEDDRCLAFLDIQPGTEGHTLIIPKRHSADLFEIEPDELAAVVSMGQKVARAQRDGLGAAGVNLAQSSGAAAFQTVFHFHLHVIPRYPDDGLRLMWTPADADPTALIATAARLRGALG